MKTPKEEFEKAKKYLSKQGYGHGSNYSTGLVAALMAEYFIYREIENKKPNKSRNRNRNRNRK